MSAVATYQLSTIAKIDNETDLTAAMNTQSMFAGMIADSCIGGDPDLVFIPIYAAAKRRVAVLYAALYAATV